MDRRLDELVVYTSLVEHLLEQKQRCEQERDTELLRLERLKSEDADEDRIQMQLKVIEQVQHTLPEIVYKLRSERNLLEQFLLNEKCIESLNESLYRKSCQLIVDVKEILERT